jgi:hypothetical protein
MDQISPFTYLWCIQNVISSLDSIASNDIIISEWRIGNNVAESGRSLIWGRAYYRVIFLEWPSKTAINLRRVRVQAGIHAGHLRNTGKKRYRLSHRVRSRVILEKPIALRLINKYFALHATWQSITELITFWFLWNVKRLRPTQVLKMNNVRREWPGSSYFYLLGLLIV